MDLSILPPFAGFFLADVDFFFAAAGLIVTVNTYRNTEPNEHTFSTLLLCHSFMEVLGLILIREDDSNHTILHIPKHGQYTLVQMNQCKHTLTSLIFALVRIVIQDFSKTSG